MQPQMDAILDAPRLTVAERASRAGLKPCSYVPEVHFLRGRDLLSIADLTPGELRRVLDTAHALKGGEGGRTTAPTALGRRGLLAGGGGGGGCGGTFVRAP